MRRLSALTSLIAAVVACGSNGSGAAPDGAAESGGDDATAQNASDAAKEAGEDAIVVNPDDGSVRGDAQSGPTLVPDGGKAVSPDGGVCSTSCAGDGGDAASPEGGACPASCSTPMDCNSCPQKAFGGWSCNNGICQFMG